jgi:polysaccharide biosynthesis protein PslL
MKPVLRCAALCTAWSVPGKKESFTVKTTTSEILLTPPLPPLADVVAVRSPAPAPAPANNKAKVRLPMIDIAKGIGIVLIVFGHDAFFQQRFGGLSELLRGFRIPFFFFISGATFSLGKRYLKTIASERADAWLKPFALTVLLMGVINIALGRSNVESMMLGLLFGTGYTVSPVAIWFLPHLWLLYVSCAALLTWRRATTTWPRRIVLLVLLVSFGYLLTTVFDSPWENAACYQVGHLDWNLISCGLPLSADFLPLTAAYFLLGHFLSARVKQFKGSLVMLALSGAALLAAYFVFRVSIDFNARRYDDLVVCTLQALIGIFVMLNISSLMTNSGLLTRMLTYIGRGSLFILLFHLQMLAWWSQLAGSVIGSPLLVSLSGLVVAVVVPLALWEIAKRNTVLSLLFLPIRKARAPQTVAA